MSTNHVQSKSLSPELPEKQRGVVRIWKAFLFSVEGLKIAWSEQAAFRQELLGLLVGFPIALLLPVMLLTKLMLIFSIVLVLVVELLNSSLESAIDLVADHFHPLAKKAKDTASAAVFICLLGTIALWITVLFSCFIHPLGKL